MREDSERKGRKESSEFSNKDESIRSVLAEHVDKSQGRTSGCGLRILCP
jgi:hypothetical protein